MLALKVVFLYAFLALPSHQSPDGKCTETNQFLPDTANCTVFYECSSSLSPIEFVCESGLCWNQATSECDFPYNVPCCSGPPTASPTTKKVTTGGPTQNPTAAPVSGVFEL